MKSLRKLCGVAIASLALAVSAFAGTISSPGYVPPPPPPTSETSTSTSNIATTIILTIVSLIR
jgi:hypothetical protein